MIGNVKSVLGLISAISWVILLGCASNAGPKPEKDGDHGSLGKKSDPNLGVQIPAHYSKLGFSQFEYDPPNPADFRHELSHGAVAYLVPDSSLELVEMKFFFRSRNLPGDPSKVAPLNLYSALLKSGGTERFTPEQLEDSLEFVAASLHAYLRDHESYLTLDAMSDDVYSLMGLFPGVVLQPRLDRDIFQLEKKRYLDKIQHRYDTPASIMGVAFEKVLYGSHPYNWKANEAEVKSLKPAAVQAYQGRGYPVDKLVVAVSGRFEKERMLKTLGALLDTLAGKSNALADSVPPFAGAKEPGVYLVDKELAQATVRLGAPGIQRPDPDYYPLSVANYIFGSGGFTSRLMSRIRSDEGLVYGVYSFVDSDYYRKGTVGVTLQTKAATAAYATKLVLEEMRRMAEEGITDEELSGAKDGLVKSLPSLFDTPFATASVFAQSEVWGRGLDHFEEYPKIIESLDKSAVENAFRKYFRPDSMRIIMVGPRQGVLAEDKEHGVKLENLGKITEITFAELDERKSE